MRTGVSPSPWVLRDDAERIQRPDDSLTADSRWCRASGGGVAHRVLRLYAVLMDCQMPEMDGFAATRAIRTHESEAGLEPTPIVALTANTLESDRQRCLEAGMDEFISKPFRLEQLQSVLSSLLSKRRSA